MEEFLKRVAFLGLGTAALTREKIEAGIENLIKKGEVTAEQGKHLAKKLWADVERNRKALGKKIDDGVKAGLAKTGVARMKDLKVLERRIEKLERQLADQQSKPSGKTARETSGRNPKKL